MEEKYPGYASKNSVFEICPMHGGTEQNNKSENSNSSHFYSYNLIVRNDEKNFLMSLPF